MAYLALSAAGAREAVALAAKTSVAVWLNAGALDKAEVQRLRATGISITVFSDPIDPSNIEAIADAVATISEHHPQEVVWVEQNAAA